MSDKKISDLVELTTLAADDVLPVVDASANATKRVTYDTLATEVRTESEPLSATTVTASGDITSNGETVYHRGNVVGTVSQSGGTPTGAVVEHDSNANGRYTKFADGTFIAFNTKTHNFGSTTQTIFSSPVPSTVEMACAVSYQATGSTPRHDAYVGSAVMSTNNDFRIVTRSTHGETLKVFFTAIGRWY